MPAFDRPPVRLREPERAEPHAGVEHRKNLRSRSRNARRQRLGLGYAFVPRIRDLPSKRHMRRRAQVGLNKGEAHHALKRAINFHQRGELRDRTEEGQHYRLASLNFLAAIIIYWNTLKLGEAIFTRKNAGLDVPAEFLAHVSPLGWETWAGAWPLVFSGQVDVFQREDPYRRIAPPPANIPYCADPARHHGVLEREVVEAGAVGPLQHLVRHGEATPVAGRRRAVAPMAGGVEAGDAMDDGGERGALVLLDETPIADVP